MISFFAHGLECCWIVFALVWLVLRFTSKQTVEHEDFASSLIYWIVFIIAILLLWPSALIHLYPFSIVILPESATTAAIGFVLSLVGVFLAVWARFTLGRNWSGNVTYKENHELIQTGPYAFVRHPIYTALTLMFLGTAILIGALGSFVAVILAVISFWMKYKREERMMTVHFPDQYPAYMKRVKALIPFVW